MHSYIRSIRVNFVNMPFYTPHRHEWLLWSHAGLLVKGGFRYSFLKVVFFLKLVDVFSNFDFFQGFFWTKD